MRKQVTDESLDAYSDLKEEGKIRKYTEIAQFVVDEWEMMWCQNMQKQANWKLHPFPTANEVAAIAQRLNDYESESVRKQVSQVSGKLGKRKCNVTGKTCSMRASLKFLASLPSTAQEIINEKENIKTS